MAQEKFSSGRNRTRGPKVMRSDASNYVPDQLSSVRHAKQGRNQRVGAPTTKARERRVARQPAWRETAGQVPCCGDAGSGCAAGVHGAAAGVAHKGRSAGLGPCCRDGGSGCAARMHGAAAGVAHKGKSAGLGPCCRDAGSGCAVGVHGAAAGVAHCTFVTYASAACVDSSKITLCPGRGNTDRTMLMRRNRDAHFSCALHLATQAARALLGAPEAA
eukprot:1158890-Pelagomonas_calceolata.AAC.11